MGGGGGKGAKGNEYHTHKEKNVLQCVASSVEVLYCHKCEKSMHGSAESTAVSCNCFNNVMWAA